MKILVTGGDGYVGAKLIQGLKGKGHEVESFDLPKNILNLSELEAAIMDKDIVYHLAALAELSYTDAHPLETFDVNIIGTKNVAEICAQYNVLLNFVSTCCIYGDPLEYPSVEDRLINPTDTYAMSKASGEYIVKMWGLSRGLRFNILRFGTVYGPSLKKEMRGDMCIQKFLEAAVKKQPINVTGDGEQARNFIHLFDLVRGLVAVTERSVVGETINLAGEEKTTINMIANFALAHGATESKYVFKRKDDFIDQEVSLEKARKILDWQPEISFSEGIKDFYKWLCSQS